MKIIDLLNKISKRELPNKTRFKVYSSCNDKNDKAFICEYDESYPGTIWCIHDDNYKFNYKIDCMRILNYEVELIEEDKIDIDSIKQLGEVSENYVAPIRENRKTINKLIQVLKQHDKEIKSIKEK